MNTKTAHITNNIANLSAGILDAFVLMNNAKQTSPGFWVDFRALQQLSSIISQNPTALTALDGVTGVQTILEKNVRLGCNTCDPSPAPYLNRMEEYLQDLKYLANNFKNATGFEKVKTLLKSGATPAATTRKLEPEAFVIRVLRSENIAGANMLEAPKTIYPGCEPDVVLTDGTLCEFKSWKNNPTNEEEDEEDIENKYNMGQSMFWNFKNGHTGYNQFKAYLSQSAVSNLNKLRYYFDERKITAVDKVGFVKTIFKDMLYNATANNNQGGLTTKGEEVFQVIWGNTALRGNLFQSITNFNAVNAEETAENLFKNMVSTISNSFYSFVLVK